MSSATAGGAPPAPTFGPGALATPANLLTLVRFLLAPVFIVLILRHGASYSAVGVGAFLALSDIVDGWVARRWGVTRSGAFLDPLADKVVVIGGMAALVANGVFWWLPVALVALREAAISAFRAVLGRRGVSVPARRGAKIKTLVQDCAIGFAILPPLAARHWVALSFLWLGVALAWWTGAQYLLDGGRVASGTK